MSKKKPYNPKGTAAATPPKLQLKSKQARQNPSYALPFGKKNFIHLGIGIAILVIGYLMMSSKEFVDATEFSMALHVAPFFTIGGYIYIVYAILMKDKPATPSSGGQA